jgi:hypothetical protein
VRALLALAVGVLLATAGLARAQEPPPRDGLRAAARALALVAAARGEAQALSVAGPDAPPGLRAALGEVARAPRAADLRELGDRMDLQAELLADLLAETPRARAALEAFADDAAGRLERELRLVEEDAARLDRASKALLAAATAGELASRRAAAAREQGEALLELGARDPVVRRVLAEAETAPPDQRVAARYRALTAHFDREADEVVAAALVVLARTTTGAADALDATGGAPARALAERVAARVQAALGGLLQVAERAIDASRRLRDEELRRVGEQARGPELEQAVRMAAAYRRQWKVPPALRATRFADVYEDRATARVVVWLEGEDRWAEGPARVDPVEPVVAALLAARDPALRARAADPRAIARLYALWEGEGEPRASRPFAGGMNEVVAAARAAGAALRTLRDLAAEAGVSQATLDDAVLVRSGLPADLLLGASAASGPASGAGGDLAADAAVERRVSDEVARVTVERGSEAGRALAAALREAAAVLGALTPRAAVVKLSDAGAGPDAPLPRAVDLVWTPDPDAEPAAWLVPPPTRVAQGARRAGGIVLAAGPVEVRAFAWDGARVVAASGPADAPGAALQLAPVAGPALVLRRAAGAARVVVLPLEGPRLALELAEPGGDAGRPLAPAPGGAWVALRPTDPAGRRVVLGREVTRGDGRVVQRLEVELPPVAGVVLSSEGSGDLPGAPRVVVAQGAKVELRVVEGGRPQATRRPFRIVDEGGALVLDRTAETLRWTADVPPGRYLALVDGARPWPFAVTNDAGSPAARIAAAAHPAGPGLEGHPAGAGLVLRVDAWPSVLAEDVRRVRWRIDGGAAPLEVVTRPGPMAPWHALELPVRLDPKAAPGARRVSATLETDQGAVEASGSFAVTTATKPIEVELRGADGERLRAVPLGGEGLLLRAGEGLERPSWVVVSPAGRARGLAPRFDGQAALALDADDPAGPWEVWVRAGRQGGEKAAGRLVVLAYAPATLQVAVAPRTGPRPIIGEKLLLEATPPLGFRGPFRVRKEGGPWAEGATLEVVVQASNEVGVTLEDQDGRRARAQVRFAGERAAAVEPVSQVRYGIVANTGQRRLFAAEYDQLQAYKKKGLPPGWVVLELGPMPAAKVRDRMFQTLPYDGPPSGTDAQVAYRSKRFWTALQASARSGFESLGVAEGEPFEVLNSPSPGGEETLKDLAARLVAEQGAWEYRLVRVRVVKAEGAVADTEPPRDPPSSPASELRLFKVANSGEGRNVTRVEVPSPLGELQVAPVFPDGLTLGKTERLGVSVLARRGALVAGRRYPGGWEGLLPDALLCAEVEVEVDVEGRSRARGVARHLGRAVAGADVGVTFAHRGPEPGDTAGRPRRAERYGLLVDPFTPERPAPVDVRFDPIWPGLLDNVPRQLVVTVRARLVPAVAAGRWPAGKAGPEPIVVEEGRVVLGGPDLPEAAVEIQATYLRQAAECPKPWPATLPPLGALRAGAQAPPPAIDGAAALTAALKGLEARELDGAEAAARQAVFARPGEAEPWAVLADVLLARERPVVALVTARWAQAQGASARAAIVAGEALLADGDVEGARAAAAEAAKLKPSGELAARLEALAAQTRE